MSRQHEPKGNQSGPVNLAKAPLSQTPSQSTSSTQTTLDLSISALALQESSPVEAVLSTLPTSTSDMDSRDLFRARGSIHHPVTRADGEEERKREASIQHGKGPSPVSLDSQE
jgi:hypothetical protein